MRPEDTVHARKGKNKEKGQWSITRYLTIAFTQTSVAKFANSREFELKNQKISVKLAAKKIVHGKLCGTALIGYAPPKHLNKIKDRQYG